MFRERFVRWLHLRFRYTGVRTLKQNEVLVFIYQQGYLYLVLILITFIAGINYANNLILGFCFLISAILCISFYLSFKQLHGITMQVVVDEVGKVGEAFNVKIILQQDRITPKYLNFKTNDQIHPFLFEEKQQSFELVFIPEQRGKFEIPPIQIYSTYPLGLVRAWTYIYLTDIYWIAPQAKVFTQHLQSYSNTGEPDLDEFKELRTFKLGDSLQSISWKQAARGQGLFVKQFEDLVDTHVMQIEYSKMPSADHEEKLCFMMELVDQCEHSQTPYSVILPHAQTENGVGEQHYIHIKTLLAQA
ncbi:DUF58 domain-containing protein [Acinetobacter rongchengensis]|uniref:DUF58 domain-containing protein n=1 Tax=Acinetobacter rongchengensis TaxID=2419601 RepID=A0A3A8F9R8_9GAMM|nr:DUF58 domain-containing protein [Acinetobacter rongchengensis]RKG37423.1 DUF58 domain-containing protein [Acinetobacter rongchengensis]